MSGVISILILTVCVILFVTEKYPAATVAMMGCIAMLIFKVCTVSEALSGFNGDIMLIVFGMQVIGIAMFSSGAAQTIAGFAVKCARNQERRFLLIACAISAILSSFLTNTAVIALMMAICASVSVMSEKMNNKRLVIPVAIAAILGGHCTMVGSTTQLTASGILNDVTGESFSMFSLAWVCVPVTIVLIGYMVLVGYSMSKRMFCDKQEKKEKRMEEGSLLPEVNQKKAAAVYGILFLVLVLFVGGWVSPGVAAMVGALLCILTKTVTQKEVFREMDWSSLIWLCSCLGIGKALQAGGGAELIAGWLMRAVGNGLSPMALFAVMVLVTMVMSQFMSNMVCLLLILPATLNMVTGMGLNPYPFAYGMCLGAALTFLTPLANGHIGMTMTAGYQFKDYVIYGAIPTVIAYGMIVLLTPLVFPLM